MKKLLSLAVILLSLISTPATLAAQEKQSAPAPKMIEFHMALMKRGPKWAPGLNKDKLHASYLLNLLTSGRAVIAGPLGDDIELVNVYILRASSAAEAKTWAEEDPAVKDGRLIVEMHPWWSEEVMKPPTKPIKFTTAYLAFLTRGAKWTPEKTPATEEIQKAHIANINRLAELKKLVVAGPFGDNGTLRGIFVFKVASLEEAKELAETDPAVKAGRLALDVQPWLVPEGVLP
ncbi:MAG TPA: YciI family protein [Pyrinomonadaceae bacterium]|nr:YciI family protein [Pyrinomonadaceae bacterium]